MFFYDPFYLYEPVYHDELFYDYGYPIDEVYYEYYEYYEPYEIYYADPIGLDFYDTAASVAGLYYSALDRAPDLGGLLNWTDAVLSGWTLPEVADEFVFSPEFQGKYGNLSNEQFVQHMYVDVLDRPPDQSGFEFYINSLNTGTLDRGDLVLGFSESPEFLAKTANQIDNSLLMI